MLPTGEAGQVLVLTALMIGIVLVLLLPVAALALVAAERAATQGAADAAALACAAAGDRWTVVDARGVVYGERVAVSATRGPTAAASAWMTDLAGWPVRTLAWRTAVQGTRCTVQARVRGTAPLWDLLGQAAGPRWWVRAAARAVLPPGPGAGRTAGA